MIHGYHMVLCTYGFWLPNDVRGSMSQKVYSPRLSALGPAVRTMERESIASKDLCQWKEKSNEKLKYPPVALTGQQAFEVAMAIGAFATDSRLNIWKFSISESHLHLVLARFRYKMETLANQLKGAATRRLAEKSLHPMEQYRQGCNDELPSMWSEGQWIVYLDSEEAIEDAIGYVEQNPVREGKKKQNWSFVRPFEGISKGGWLTYL